MTLVSVTLLMCAFWEIVDDCLQVRMSKNSKLYAMSLSLRFSFDFLVSTTFKAIFAVSSFRNSSAQFFKPACRGVTRGAMGGAIPRAPNHYWGAESLRRAPKSPNNVTSAFFNTVHLLPKELRFEHGGRRRQTCFLPRAPFNLVTPLPAWCSNFGKLPNSLVKIYFYFSLLEAVLREYL